MPHFDKEQLEQIEQIFNGHQKRAFPFQQFQEESKDDKMQQQLDRIERKLDQLLAGKWILTKDRIWVVL